MTARSSDEPHRVASQLELLFDLTFVIAIAGLTSQFAHAIAEGHALDVLPSFLQVFFAIWWAWMNFTWFASSFDTDDVPFRLLTLLQMAGVLVLAAGVPAALEDGSYRAVTIGYLIMRAGLFAQWLRVALEDPASRTTALRYATGIAILELAWVLRLLVAEAGWLSDDELLALFGALVVAELAVPVWAELKHACTWHPHHIAERYGLFAIILMGESVFAASNGVQRGLAVAGVSGRLVLVSASGLVLVFALWWLYFLQPAAEGLTWRRERSFVWGYGHYGIFAALTALGAGLETAVEQGGHDIGASSVAVGYAIAVPVALYLWLLWAVHAPITRSPVLRTAPMLGGGLAILALPVAAQPLGLAVVLAGIALTCALVVASALAPARERVGVTPA